MSAPILRSDALYGRLLIRVRDMTAGDRLPSVRQLMDEYRVSQATIDRAVGRLKEEGFVEAQLGRGLFAMGKRRLGTIGLLMSDDSSHFNFLAMRQARRVLTEAGYDVRLGTYHSGDSIADTVAELSCDGMIVLPTGHPRLLQELHELRPSATPTVLMDLMPEHLDLNAVATDNTEGGAQAARHLIGLGHRRLAIILAEPDLDSQRARIAGFTHQAGLTSGVSIEVIGCLEMMKRDLGHIPGGSYAIAHYGVGRILRERGSLGATAAFADSDMGALGAMKALHEAGVAMPRTVSVIGFDDLPEARYFHPALTTIRQDLTSWFQVALRIIETRLSGQAGPVQRIRITPELVVRESTGPVTNS
jgi:DNA-binding LacI/PurR family transcriptional regulator